LTSALVVAQGPNGIFDVVVSPFQGSSLSFLFSQGVALGWVVAPPWGSDF
jgi:hypothetical protein